MRIAHGKCETYDCVRNEIRDEPNKQFTSPEGYICDKWYRNSYMHYGSGTSIPYGPQCVLTICHDGNKIITKEITGNCLGPSY